MAKLVIVLIVSAIIVHSRSLAGISAFKSPYSLIFLLVLVVSWVFCAFICGSLPVTPLALIKKRKFFLSKKN